MGLLAGRVLRILFFWSLRGTVVGMALLLITGGYFWLSTDLPAPGHLRAQAARGNTRILDRHGHVLYQVPDPFGGYQHPVPLDSIPVALQYATIAVEDARFYHHPGIDARGILRATWSNLRHRRIVAGGSTITQQLARNFLLDPHYAHSRTLERKARESILALKLTAHFSKDEILALYLNQTYYGNMAYGVESAAQRFFGKPVHELDLAECALLAGLPQAPSRYNPFANPQAATHRQHQVLDAMVRHHFITPAQAKAAREEPLHFADATTPIKAPHFVFYVINLLTDRYGPEVVARGGLTITTTLDLDLQDMAQRRLQRQITLLNDPQETRPVHETHSGAIVVLDPTSGAILAMVGSPDFYNTAHQGQVNGALAPRQPGSAIKPLTYAAALERGWTPATIVSDVPVSFTDRQGRPYRPENYNHIYQGTISLREALATSSNVAAVRVLHDIGIPSLLDMADRLGIATLNRDSSRYGLALTLGSGEVTLLELTAAYGVFANGGYRVPPRPILAVDGARRTESYPHPPVPIERGDQVLAPQVAYLISDILSDRYARLHTFGEAYSLILDRPAAVKTGTTNNWHDVWTVGYTPQRVTGVWLGNADGQPMESMSGVDGAGPVWNDVMQTAHHNIPPLPFARPDGIVEMTICADTGAAASSSCPHQRQERFIEGTRPRPAQHEQPAAAGQAHRSNRHQTTASSASPTWPNRDTTRHAPHQQQPSLLTPADGAFFAFSPGVPLAHQQIELRAYAGDNTSSVTFIIDGKPVATLHAAPYRAFWPLEPGTHHALVETTDTQGRVQRSQTITFEVQKMQEDS